MDYIDLLLDNGEIIRLEAPAKFSDDIHEAITDTMKRRDWLCVERWQGCDATYLGHGIRRINMARVVGTL
jgi:hypothetical protein